MKNKIMNKDLFEPQNSVSLVGAVFYMNIHKMVECYFVPRKDISSATICIKCGLEKMLHTIGEGIKVNKGIIIIK